MTFPAACNWIAVVDTAIAAVDVATLFNAVCKLVVDVAIADVEVATALSSVCKVAVEEAIFPVEVATAVRSVCRFVTPEIGILVKFMPVNVGDPYMALSVMLEAITPEANDPVWMFAAGIKSVFPKLVAVIVKFVAAVDGFVTTGMMSAEFRVLVLGIAEIFSSAYPARQASPMSNAANSFFIIPP